MPTPADTIKTITHNKNYTVTTTTVTKPPTPKDSFDFMAVLTLILPIITFLAGYYLNLYFENRKERKRLKDVKEYFLVLVGHLIEILTHQIKAIEDAISRIKQSPDNDVYIQNRPELDTKRIRAISEIDLYNIFMDSQKRVENAAILLNNLSSAVNFIDSTIAGLNRINSNMKEISIVYTKSRNKIMISMQNRHSSLVVSGKILTFNAEEETMAEYLGRIDLYTLYTQNYKNFVDKKESENIKPTDSRKMYEYFMKPLYEDTRHIVTNKDTYEMLMDISNMQSSYKEFSGTKDWFTSKLSRLVKGCQNAISQLNIIREQISK